MFLCFTSLRACCCLQTLHALRSNQEELVLSLALKECRAFIFAPQSLVTPCQDFPKGSDVPFVLDGVFIIAFQVPVLLSVLSNSYGEERGYNKTWIQNSHAVCLPQGSMLGGASCPPFPP